MGQSTVPDPGPSIRWFLASAMNGLVELLPEAEVAPEVLQEPLPASPGQPHRIATYRPVSVVWSPTLAITYVRDGVFQDRDRELVRRAVTEQPEALLDRAATARSWVDRHLETAAGIGVVNASDADLHAAAYYRAAEAIEAYLPLIPVLDIETTGEFVRRLVWVLIQARRFPEAAEAADAWLRRVRLPYHMIQKIRSLQATARQAALQETTT